MPWLLAYLQRPRRRRFPWERWGHPRVSWGFVCPHSKITRRWFRIFFGFRFSDITLKLQEIWPARRDRWWVVLSAQSLGKIPLQAFPWILPHKVVRNILPKPLSISKEDLDQLILKGDELMRFLEFQPDLSSMYLPLGGLCPTLLHSLGSQTVGCMCGCRDVGFNDGTLQKGLFGVLMPTDSN